jgi:hypothetical protein
MLDQQSLGSCASPSITLKAVTLDQQNLGLLASLSTTFEAVMLNQQNQLNPELADLAVLGGGAWLNWLIWVNWLFWGGLY